MFKKRPTKPTNQKIIFMNKFIKTINKNKTLYTTVLCAVVFFSIAIIHKAFASRIFYFPQATDFIKLDKDGNSVITDNFKEFVLNEAIVEHNPNKKTYEDFIELRPIKEETFKEGEYVIQNKGQCDDERGSDFECAVLNIEKVADKINKEGKYFPIHRIQMLSGYISYSDSYQKFIFTSGSNKVEILSIKHHTEEEPFNYLIVETNRYHADLETKRIYGPQKATILLRIGEQDGKTIYYEDFFNIYEFNPHGGC